ncbi:helix-turn-helix transcriptional regulator [Arthrobacter sp. MSA 4-2]|uniref:helix-turn-helix transcriptional regulator n=1 Tax=Arthrobacter sp. MSA 4-2 TaxID=2794349 RepID=UPI0018E7D70F|nr:helix-turn-helix transcriptional regulator [Arthrobacter sp. MSA 4-2]MBJ2120880.1 helix-turn-helix transcriptional regulator [Arthrobacter sp. MSA 4-2]
MEKTRNTIDGAALTAAQFLGAKSSDPISLGDVADHVGYSPSHLVRLFESVVGVPPGRYLAQLRFERAKTLLLTSGEPVRDICFEVGFTSLGTFSRRFAEGVGYSPGRFRVLPHILADHPPRPLHLPTGLTSGGTISGVTVLSRAARDAVGPNPALYVGLFTTPSAKGRPVTSSLLDGVDTFAFVNVPPGRFWVLASALPGAAEPLRQLVPLRSVYGRTMRPILVGRDAPHHHVAIELEPAEEWQLPVLLAVPALASAGT